VSHVDKAAQVVTVQRRFADGVLTNFPKTERSRRSISLTECALDAYERLPAQLHTRLVFPAPKGGYISIDNWRTRVDALNAAGIDRRGPYHLRHTFATEALVAGVSIFELARVMGASVKEIDRTYGHLARVANDSIRARLEARAKQPGINLASESD
jgi:integrase